MSAVLFSNSADFCFLSHEITLLIQLNYIVISLELSTFAARMRRLLLSILFFTAVFSGMAQEATMPDIAASTENNSSRYHGDGIDDVLQYSPLAATIALKLFGVESKSEWGNLLINTTATYANTAIISYMLKHSVNSRRPDGTDNHSFPSAHTAIAFAGATIMTKEYWHVSPWIGVGAYTVATITAADRVRRNRHRWIDVAAGAAIGIATAELGYYIGGLILPDREQYSLSVSPTGLELVVKL